MLAAEVGALVLELGAGLVALGAAASQWRVRRLVIDPRVTRLALFFLLYAAAALIHAATSAAYAGALERGTVDRQGFDGFDVAFWAHHVLLLVALAIAVAALGPPRWRQATPAAAAAPVLLAAEPILRFAETLALLYLVVVAALNHVRRRTVGSIRVAAGFLFLLAAQAGHLATTSPLGFRPWWAEALALAGILGLLLSVPRRGS